MPKWISIEKEKPVHRQNVLISDGNIVTAAQADLVFLVGDGIWWDECGFSGHRWEWDFDMKAISHWMPLPEAP